jgi:short-subunit dehydrogenase
MKKNILITGSGTGIGRNTAFALCQRGHHVFATTHNESQTAALLAESRQAGLVMEIFKLDITVPEDREKVLDLPLDVLINNAAIGESGSLAEVPVDRIRRTFEVNVFATLELSQLALRGMIERQHGTVIFISSLAGRIPMRFMMPYSMSKFAISAAGAGLRAEMKKLGKNIQVSLIEPGTFHTGFNQNLAARKLESMGAESYFNSLRETETAKGERLLRLIEVHDTRSIVTKIVKACEADRPDLRYVAPWLQGAIVRMARMLGA